MLFFCYGRRCLVQKSHCSFVFGSDSMWQRSWIHPQWTQSLFGLLLFELALLEQGYYLCRYHEYLHHHMQLVLMLTFESFPFLASFWLWRTTCKLEYFIYFGLAKYNTSNVVLGHVPVWIGIPFVFSVSPASHKTMDTAKQSKIKTFNSMYTNTSSWKISLLIVR